MTKLLSHLRRARNRLSHNTEDLDHALALAELQRLPSGQIHVIRRALASNKRLFTAICGLHARLNHTHNQQP